MISIERKDEEGRSTLATRIFSQCFRILLTSCWTSSGRMRDLREPRLPETLRLTRYWIHGGVVLTADNDQSALLFLERRFRFPGSHGDDPPTGTLSPRAMRLHFLNSGLEAGCRPESPATRRWQILCQSDTHPTVQCETGASLTVKRTNRRGE